MDAEFGEQYDVQESSQNSLPEMEEELEAGENPALEAMPVPKEKVMTPDNTYIERKMEKIESDANTTIRLCGDILHEIEHNLTKAQQIRTNRFKLKAHIGADELIDQLYDIVSNLTGAFNNTRGCIHAIEKEQKHIQEVIDDIKERTEEG